MLVVGLILLAVAITAAVVLIVQNRDVTIDVHALGHTQSVHPYWIVVAGAGHRPGRFARPRDDAVRCRPRPWAASRTS
jgi:hypothetical protein